MNSIVVGTREQAKIVTELNEVIDKQKRALEDIVEAAGRNISDIEAGYDPSGDIAQASTKYSELTAKATLLRSFARYFLTEEQYDIVVESHPSEIKVTVEA